MADHPEREIIHRHLDRNGDEPGVQVATIVAELEGRDPTTLTDMYGCVDGVLDHFFATPPSPEAQLKIEFTYEGYRISIEQDGTAAFVKTD